MQNGIQLTPEQQLSLIDGYGGVDAWGTDAFAPHTRAVGPGGIGVFQWGKQVASHLGGTATAWSSLAGADPRRRRVAFPVPHFIDLGPTFSSARPPERRWWTGQRSRWRERVSCTASTTRPRPSGTPCSTSRSTATGVIYQDGWWAACRLDRIPWDASPPSIARFAPGTYDPEQDTWELDDLPDDFTQANDVAAEHPEKLAELKDLFWAEAAKHNVLPLMAGFSVFFGILPPMPTVTTHTFYGDVENIVPPG